MQNFAGREQDLALLDKLKTGARLATINGVAGIGKTTLAVHFGHQVAGDFPDGQLYVNLRGFDPAHPPMQPNQALAHLIRGLGVDPSFIPPDIDDQMAMYRSLLMHKRTLIVLDNAATSEQVRPLFPGSPTCLVLVTSRNGLGGLTARDGASRISLEALETSHGLELIGGIAGTDRVAADPAAASHIVQLCGGLPLALCIAAERVAARPYSTLGDLAAELQAAKNPLHVLAAPFDDAASVPAAFSWSYNAIADGPRHMFRLLGLHAGPDISSAAAAALADITVEEAVSRLDTLVDARLLDQSGKDRYRLHDLVKYYAASQAEHEETPTGCASAIHRISSWYARTCYSAALTVQWASTDDFGITSYDIQPMNFTSRAHALAWFDLEIANLRAYVQQAAASSENKKIAWQIAICAARASQVRKRWPDWFPMGQLGLKAAQNLGDLHAEAWCRYSLGIAHAHQRRYGVAIELQRSALSTFEEIGDQEDKLTVQRGLGCTYFWAGEMEAARYHYEKNLNDARDWGNSTLEGYALNNIGEFWRNMGDYAKAEAYLKQAIPLLQATRHLVTESNALNNLGATYRDSGDLEGAFKFLNQALALRKTEGDRWGQAWTMHDLGTTFRIAGNTASARDHLLQALAIYQELGAPEAEDVKLSLDSLT